MYDSSDQNGFPPEVDLAEQNDGEYARIEDVNKALAKIGITVVFDVMSDGTLVAYNFKQVSI